MGQSPATQPTSNRGAEAGALQLVAAAKTFLDKASGMVGASSEMGMKIADVLKTLSKLAPAGSSSPQGEKNAMQNAMMSNAQNNQAMQQMRARMQGSQGGGGAQAPQGGQGMAA